MAQEVQNQNKCNCTKGMKTLEKKVSSLEKEVAMLYKQIEVLKRALNSRGV